VLKVPEVGLEEAIGRVTEGDFWDSKGHFEKAVYQELILNICGIPVGSVDDIAEEGLLHSRAQATLLDQIRVHTHRKLLV